MVSKKAVVLLTVVAGLGALCLPLSNLVLPRQRLEVKSADPQVKRVSELLQNSCADCHSPNLTSYPYYFNLPVAHEIIAQDIAEAQAEFVLDREMLEGIKPFNDAQLAKIREVMADDSMPPLKYKAMHWNSFISPADKKFLLDWIDSQSPAFGIKAIPEGNPFQASAAKVALGKRLFNDKRLSGDNTISCAGCHALDKGGTDQAVVSTGIKGQKGPINAPTVFNAAYNFAQFWDGRAPDLKAQAAGPVNNPLEMGSNWSQVISKLSKDAGYTAAFKSSYPQGIDADSITDAIAAYETTLLTANSRFDRYLKGDKTSLSADEQQGYQLFLANNCATCHAGVNLGGQTYEKMGIAKNYFAGRKLTEADNGRYNVTHQEVDRHKFKVPTLRNIALTYPYFHDGSTNDLKQAVKIMSEYQLGKTLSEHDADLIAQFLAALTGDIPKP